MEISTPPRYLRREDARSRCDVRSQRTAPGQESAAAGFVSTKEISTPGPVREHAARLAPRPERVVEVDALRRRHATVLQADGQEDGRGNGVDARPANKTARVPSRDAAHEGGSRRGRGTWMVPRATERERTKIDGREDVVWPHGRRGADDRGDAAGARDVDDSEGRDRTDEDRRPPTIERRGPEAEQRGAGAVVELPA